MNISKRFFFKVLISIVLCFSIVYSFNQYSAKPKYRSTIRIAGDNNFPPYEFVDDSGIYKGFNVDIIHAIAIELGLDIEIIPMKWQDALAALEKGKVDLIQGMTRSTSRDKKYTFSNELVINSQVIFVKEDTSYISELKDLSGHVVALQKGDITEEKVRQMESIKIEAVDNQREAMQLLVTGGVDAFVGNRLTGLYNLQKYYHNEGIKIVGEPLMTTRYCSAAVIGNNWAIDIINEGMSKIKENKTYDKIYYKWFGEEVGGKYRKRSGMLKVLAAALTVSLLCFFAAFYINRRLKKAVYTRTMELAAANVELNYQNDELSKYNIELEILNSRLNNEIKERKRAEEIIWYQAHYDFLTDLPNRKLFIDKLEEALKEVENRDERLAVLFLDLDNYKYINDTSGHEVGDKLLQEVAKRLRNMAGENEVVSRFGGDEFTILIKSFKDIKYVTDFAEKMFDMMKEPFVIENWQIKQTASLGIGIYPDSGRDAQTLLRRADALMYSAKEKGGNDYKIHKEK